MDSFFIPSEYWRTLLLRVSAPPPPTTIRFFFGLARQPFQLIPPMASSSFSFFLVFFLSLKIAFQIFEDKIVNER
jgi:hypothetical protein